MDKFTSGEYEKLQIIMVLETYTRVNLEVWHRCIEFQIKHLFKDKTLFKIWHSFILMIYEVGAIAKL